MSFIPPPQANASGFDVAQARQNEEELRRRAERYSATHDDGGARAGLLKGLLPRVRGPWTMTRREH